MVGMLPRSAGVFQHARPLHCVLAVTPKCCDAVKPIGVQAMPCLQTTDFQGNH